MSSQNVYLTPEAFEKLKDDLQFMRTKERARIALAIADARAQGDLSENAEYDAAKEAQGHLEARIAQLEETLANARIVDEGEVDTSTARILSRVRVKNHVANKEAIYTLVSASEADFAANRISVESPIGRGLLGKAVGDVIEIKVPAGKVKLEVLEISR
jgi:transcription elongation factor GreA